MAVVLVGVAVRDYQRSIADSALKNNTLVVLPTGLGKTVIALLVALERLSAVDNGKALMLAPTRPLVLQHARFFQEHLSENFPTAVLTGEVSPENRRVLFETSRLIFATPEVIRNDVAEGRYSLGPVCLVVFDEAHRCVRDYAYSEVAAAYKRQASNPLILGLTASPSARKSRIEEICEKLAISKVESRTETDTDVEPYVKDVTLDWVRVPLPPAYKQISKILRTALDERTQKLRMMRQLPAGVPPSKRILLELGERLRERIRRGASGTVYGAVVLQAQSMSLLHLIEMLETQGVHSLTRALERLGTADTRSARGLAKDPRILEAQKLSEPVQEVHPKMKRLRELVTKELVLNRSSKIIVFTQFRDTVEMIVNDLNKLDGVSASRFVGQATRREDDRGLTQSEQVRILERFGEGEFNVLVTTSIGEEGLHVPDVDHVVFYEAIPSEIRTIQRRGRTGRTRPGKMTVLMAEGTIDEAYYWSSRRKEQQMHRLLDAVKKGGKPERRKTNLLDYA